MLNSRGEYNRCEIARLVLGEEQGGKDIAEEQANQEREIKDWINSRAMDKTKEVVVEKINGRTHAGKMSRDMRNGARNSDKPSGKTDKMEDDLKKFGGGRVQWREFS